MTDISVAVRAIQDRQDFYDDAEKYYDGTVEEVFANPRMRRIFKGGTFRLNFSRTVVDSVLNRLEVANIVGTDDQSNAMINQIFEQNELAMEMDEVHRRALQYGDCYVMVWPDENGEVLISYNSPKSTVLVYDEENPRKKSYAVKVWPIASDNLESETPEGWRLNVYYADRIEKYKTQGNLSHHANNWKFMEEIENPFGEVPVFHFRTQRPYGRPEHADAYEPQDMINKLASVHMSVVDYQGAPQRYALSASGASEEITDFDEEQTDRENLGSLQNGPGELWYLKGVTKVGQFDPADPKAFLEPYKEYIRTMASLTNTPLHYFERTGNVPSGEALRVAEAPLLKKVKDRQQAFGAAWRDLFRFALKINGIESDVQVRWHAVESIDSLDTWTVAQKKKEVGLPIEQILAEMGYDSEVIEEITKTIGVDAPETDE